MPLKKITSYRHQISKKKKGKEKSLSSFVPTALGWGVLVWGGGWGVGKRKWGTGKGFLRRGGKSGGGRREYKARGTRGVRIIGIKENAEHEVRENVEKENGDSTPGLETRLKTPRKVSARTESRRREVLEKKTCA